MLKWKFPAEAKYTELLQMKLSRVVFLKILSWVTAATMLLMQAEVMIKLMQVQERMLSTLTKEAVMI